MNGTIAKCICSFNTNEQRMFIKVLPVLVIIKNNVYVTCKTKRFLQILTPN